MCANFGIGTLADAPRLAPGRPCQQLTMHCDRRRFLTLLVALAAPRGADASEQAYPDKPIRIINPFPSGSPVDVIGRLVADRLEKTWGQPVLVESKSGAGGTVGANFVAKSPPDGYTLLVTSASTLATAPALFKSLPYDPIKDFAPIWAVKSSGQVVVVNPALPVNNLQDLVQYAKAHPGQVSYASSGFGTVQHLAGELFIARTGAPLVHVPYRGGAPATNDLLGGHIQVMFDAIGNTLANINAGKLRALAVLRAKRAAVLPDVPTAAEAGVPGVELNGWVGLFAPAETPRDILDKLSATVASAMADQDLSARLIAAGNDTDFLVGPALGERLMEDKESIAAIVKAAGIQPE
jgi:tripartite-type tricarboxylate transporter receptor subunit TctC